MTELFGKSRVLAPWTVEKSTHVFRDKWISVRADSCRTQEGVVIAPFYVLEYPDCVQIVALDEADHVILVEQYRHGLGIISLELPTGGMEAGETDAISAGRRELLEETGFEADDWQHIATLAPNPANQSNRCHIVLARGARPTGICNDDPTERLRILRLPAAQVAHLARTGSIVQAMQVAALALGLTHIGHW